jgi:glucan phosphoethanolaminetransferase (alkaline phosphatase superfamily)
LTTAAEPSRSLSRLRDLSRVRRAAKVGLLALPVALVIGVDVAVRGHRLAALPPKYLASYAIAVVESATLWALLLYAASSRRGAARWVAAAVFCAFAMFAIGGQIYFEGQYSTYLNLDATLWGTSLSESLLGQLRADGRHFLTSIAPPLALAIALVWASRRVVRPLRTRASTALRAAAIAATAAVFLIPCSYRTVQASTPDVIYFHAIGGLAKQLLGVRTQAQVRPGLRKPPKLPALHATPPLPRDVLFILTESVRADASCSAHGEACPNTPETDAATPARSPLEQMRSNSSTTAIELAVLWSGLEPVESREALHTAPLLFDYAHAAGIDAAYWTSHHMMFANSRLFVQDLPTSHQCGATDLDPLADIDLGAKDELLTARVERDLPTMKEPFFAVAHYGNTHVPYRVDPAEAPFQPSVESKAPGDNEAYRNYYKNAVYLQDKTVAALVRWVRAQPFGGRTVIVFTSDHGEAFREHDQVGHTGSILDEEIHVPFWIDAPRGTLTDVEAKALDAARDRFVFHTDVTPTILDLMGLADAPELAPFTKGLVGSSLLRAPGPVKTLRMTNCSGIWGCAFKNWGVMRGALKLEGREWDDRWRCYDVAADPREAKDLGPAGCGDLVSIGDATFGGVPSAVAQP